ncbi:MAG: hypothetical protein M3394_07315, partial [Actinomycetota bacterium]|nr:hypothetical protein [Actinomycetota bacterium]
MGLVLGALSASLLPLSAARAAGPKPVFEPIGTLDRFPADARALLGTELVPLHKDANFIQKGRAGTAIVVPEARQVWQIYFSASNSDRWAAVIRDLDTLSIIRTLDLPGGVDRSTINQFAGEWSFAIDGRGQRLFLVDMLNRGLLEIDLRTFAILSRPLLSSVQPVPGLNGLFPALPGGLTYDPFTDDLLVLYGGPQANSVADTNTFLYTVDVSKPPAPADPALLHQLQSCGGPLTSVDIGGRMYGWEMLPTKDFLYLPCHRAGNAGAVVRIARPTPETPRPREEIVIGPVYVDSVFADPASGRLFFMTIEREIWVFEAQTMSFIGILAAGPERTNDYIGFGLDRQTGRVFFQSPSFGLGVAEGRFFPMPQARTLARKVTGHERIFSDAKTGRVFVLEGADDTKQPSYRIYQADAAPVPPAPADPDRNTVDMDEQEGVTETRYFASGSGYGLRVLLAKGLSTVAPAPSAGNVSPTAQLIDDNINSKCGYTDREMVAGRVRKAEYDTGSTAAAAIAFDVDGATKQDLDKPSRCDVTGRDQNGTERFSGIFSTSPVTGAPGLPVGPGLDEALQAPRDDPDTPDTDESRPRWTLDQAECTSSDEATKKTANAKTPTVGPAAVACPAPGEKLVASATAGQFQGGISFSKAFTETSIERTSEGVKSTVTAVVQNLDIAGVIRFGEIRSTAVSQSNGRPKRGDMSVHDVVVRGAEVNGVAVCDNCLNMASLLDTLNSAAGGRAIFRTAKGATSGLDEDLKRGSPLG